MKIRLWMILLVGLLTACQRAAAAPITTTTDVEFTLSEGQLAEVSDANISITFVSVFGDSRCPSGMECAMSGPVTLSLSFRDQSGAEMEQTLQTFTDVKGLAPEMEFEGIQDRVTVDGYQIKILSVLPYPQSRSFSIGEPDYQISLKVTKAQ